jgi:membrane protein implicated in regulation of membrane protease activity
VFLVIAIGLAIFVLPEAWGPPAIALGAAIEITETAVSVWWSRRGRIKVGPETLIGASATVVVACRPDGRVRIRGDSWAATCEMGADPGQRVRVVARDGLRLVVEPSVD